MILLQWMQRFRRRGALLSCLSYMEQLSVCIYRIYEKLSSLSKNLRIWCFLPMFCSSRKKIIKNGPNGIPKRLATSTDKAMLDKVVSSSFDTINAAPHVRFSRQKNRSSSLRSILSLRSVLRSSGLSFGGRPGPRPDKRIPCALQYSRFSAVL